MGIIGLRFIHMDLAINGIINAKWSTMIVERPMLNCIQIVRDLMLSYTVQHMNPNSNKYDR